MPRYEVVRDDGNMLIGLGPSVHTYELDDQGQFWQVSPISDWRTPATGAFPREAADLVAVRSFIAHGTYSDDAYWLLYVKEVTP